MNFIYHWLGMDNGSGHVYLFWSGIGSDLGEFAIVGAIYKSRNCQVQRCWRIGLHKTDGGHVTCRRHHPDGALTAQAVADAHDAARSA